MIQTMVFANALGKWPFESTQVTGFAKVLYQGLCEAPR